MIERKTTVSIIAAVLILVAIFLAWAFSSRWGSPAAPAAAPLVNGIPAPTFAPKGEAVSGFPTDLILKDNPSITESYAIEYSSSTHQYTAEWNSSSSVDAVVAQYAAFLRAQGWEVRIPTSTNSWFRGVSATTSTASLFVSAAEQGNESQVTLSYVPR